LTGGGSGGHITPLLSLAQELKSQAPDCRIIYIGHKGDNFDNLNVSTHNFDFMVFIRAGKFRRYHGGSLLSRLFDLKTLALNARDFFRLPGSIISSYRAMRRFRPDVVFSKGGFVAVPVGVAAKVKGVPIITHDSDTVPGLANRIVGRWARIHATGMPAKFYNYPPGSIEYVGIPIDGRIEKVTPKIQKECKKRLKIPEDSEVLMVSGGGNGSKRLNDLVLSIAPNLLEANLSLYIIHLTGQMHETEVKAGYKATLPKTEQGRVYASGFTPDFYSYAAAADLIITRAGATTMAELSAAGKACVLIPAPFLAGGHQLKNAQELEKKDAAAVISEDVKPDELLVVVSELLNNDSRRWELAKNLYTTARPDAAAKLASLILQTARREE
jgi:UDP-N-acetylglucosamine--N-acetylmuramyl-(pentapeptide) pyrophosphoryl-undecaprenol N-acetylglucosamine transferase